MRHNTIGFQYDAELSLRQEIHTELLRTLAELRTAKVETFLHVLPVVARHYPSIFDEERLWCL